MEAATVRAKPIGPPLVRIQGKKGSAYIPIWDSGAALRAPADDQTRTALRLLPL